MRKERRFLVGGVVVAGTIGYLVVTGMQESMVYYFTPAELVAKTTADPSFNDLGVKVGGRVVPGTVSFDQRTLDLRFEVVDIETGAARFPVHYQGPLPDTFEEGRDVVVEGRFTSAGIFEATTVLTKCGSRYEAEVEDYAARPRAQGMTTEVSMTRLSSPGTIGRATAGGREAPAEYPVVQVGPARGGAAAGATPLR